MKKLKTFGVVAFGAMTLSQGAFATETTTCTSLGDGSEGALQASGSITFTGSANGICVVSGAMNSNLSDANSDAITIGDGTTAISTSTSGIGDVVVASSAVISGTIGSSSAYIGSLTISGATTGTINNLSGATTVYVNQLGIGVTGVSSSVLETSPGTNTTPTAGIAHFATSGAVVIASAAEINTSATLGASKLLIGSSGSLQVTSGGITGGGLIESYGGDIVIGASLSATDTSSNMVNNIVNISAAVASSDVDVTFGISQSLTGSIDNKSGTAGNGMDITFAELQGDATLMTGDIGVTAPVATLTVDVGEDANAIEGVSATITGNVQAQTITVNGTNGALIVTGYISGATTLTLNQKLVVQDGISGATVSTINVGSGFANGDTVIDTDPANETSGLSGWVIAPTSGATTINMPANFTDGALKVIVNSAAFTDSQVNGTFTVGNSFLADYTVVNDTQDNALVVSASAKSTDSVAATLGINSSDAAALVAVAGFVSGAQADALTAAFQSSTEAKKAAQQIGVQTDTLSASTAAAAQVSISNVNVNTGRLAALRGYNPWVEGFNADDHTTQGAWGKVFGQWTEQSERDGVSGFDTTTSGFTAGYDRAINSKVNLGGSLTIADTEVEGQGAGASTLDIKSYIFSAYGDYNTKKYFIEGLLSFGMMDSTATRQLTFGGLNQEGSAQYDGNQVTAYVGYGRNYKLGSWNFIPVGSFQYTLVSNDDYNESGLGDLNLTVDQESINIAIIKAAATFNRRYAVGTDMDFIPAFRTSLGFDVAGDEANATASFQGSTAQFQSTGADIAQLMFGAGFGAGLNSGDFTASFDYDLDVRADFVGHNFALKGKYEF